MGQLKAVTISCIKHEEEEALRDGLLYLWMQEFSSNISNTGKSVSSDIQTLRSALKKRGAAEFF